MKVHNATRRPYWISPLDSRGQKTFESTAGRMLKKATTPLGVVDETRSKAAERMITYRTERKSVTIS